MSIGEWKLRIAAGIAEPLLAPPPGPGSDGRLCQPVPSSTEPCLLAMFGGRTNTLPEPGTVGNVVPNENAFSSSIFSSSTASVVVVMRIAPSDSWRLGRREGARGVSEGPVKGRWEAAGDGCDWNVGWEGEGGKAGLYDGAWSDEVMPPETVERRTPASRAMFCGRHACQQSCCDQS